MSAHGYLPPTLLANNHVVESFECRSVEQTQWLRRYARQSAAASTTRVLVVTQRGRVEVVGYYAWCMASIAVEAAPQRLRKGAGRYPRSRLLCGRVLASVSNTNGVVWVHGRQGVSDNDQRSSAAVSRQGPQPRRRGDPAPRSEGRVSHSRLISRPSSRSTSLSG